MQSQSNGRLTREIEDHKKVLFKKIVILQNEKSNIEWIHLQSTIVKEAVKT